MQRCALSRIDYFLIVAKLIVTSIFSVGIIFQLYNHTIQRSITIIHRLSPSPFPSIEIKLLWRHIWLTNSKISQKSKRSTSCNVSEHCKRWNGCVDEWTRGFVDTYIRRYAELGYVDTYIRGHVDAWIREFFRHVYTWIRGHVETWILGYVNTWIGGHGYRDTWIRGYLDLWPPPPAG
jgi:hypothetical protein